MTPPTGNISTAEILKKVRKLEIRSRKLTQRLFSGEYHSAFRGTGMLFKEVREYAPGDDPRFIDWNVSARFGHPYSKLFEEERERSVLLMIDMSGSQWLGARERTVAELCTEIAAVLAFSAQSNHDKVGALFFTDRIEQFIPPAKGRRHLLYIVRQMLTLQPQSRGTDLEAALKFVRQTARHRSILFLISDLVTNCDPRWLRAVGHRHDAIAIEVGDASLQMLPDAGLLAVEDPESGAVYWVDSGDPYIRRELRNIEDRRRQYTRQVLRQSGWDHVACSTDSDYVQALQAFLLRRGKS